MDKRQLICLEQAYGCLPPKIRNLVDLLDGLDLMPLREKDRVTLEVAIRGVLEEAYDGALLKEVDQ